MTEAGNQGPGIRERRDRLWFRRVFTIGGAAVLVWLYLETLAVAAGGKASLENVLLALVAGIAGICGYYVKRRADAERGLE